MAKSIKLENDNYLDSSSIVHKRELLSDILKKRNVIYDKTLTNDSAYISIPCDILRDGGIYELICIGKLTVNADVGLRLNNNSEEIYYQSGFGYNFTGTTANSEGTLWQGYRPSKSSFYITGAWKSNTNCKCITKYTISLLQADDFPVMTSETGVTFSGNSQNGQASCQTSITFKNITSIDLLSINSSSSFVTGTRFILRKI